jgi:hypothetical protein
MRFGDSTYPNVNQNLTCFLINPSNGDTILGGSSTAPTFINQYSQQISVNTSTIFLISMTSSMEIIWHKQYFRDLNDLTL